MWNLIWKEWKEVSSKKFVLSIFLVSIILIIGTSYIVSKERHDIHTPYVTIGVADCDNSLYSNMLLEYFKQDDNFSNYALVEVGTTAQLQEKMKQDELDAYLILPKDFAKNLIQIKQVPIEVKINARDSTTAIVLGNVLKSYEQYISAVEINAVALYEIMKVDGMNNDLIEKKNREISIELVMTALGRDTFFDYKEDNKVTYDSLSAYYLSAMVAILLLYLGMIPGLRLLKEREEHVLDRIRISRTRIISYYFTKWIFYTFLFSILINMGYLILCLIMKQNLQEGKMVVVNIFVSVSILISFLGAEICKKQRIFLLVGNITYLLCAVIGGAVIPIMYLPDLFYHLAQFTPNYWFMRYLLSV